MSAPLYPFTRIIGGGNTATKLYYQGEKIWPRPVAGEPYVIDASSGFGYKIIVPYDDEGVGDPTVGALMYCLGYSGTPASATSAENEVGQMLREVVRLTGRAMFVPNIAWGWGNDADLASMEAAMSILETDLGHDTTNLTLLGGSMGGTTIATYAKNHPGDVTTVGLFGPVSDLNDMLAGPFGTAINNAYGGAYVEATHGADHNPVTMAAAGAFNGIRWKTWYSEGDMTCRDYTIESVLDDVTGSRRAKTPGGSHNCEIHKGLATEIAAWIQPPDPVTRTVDGDKLVTFTVDGTFTAESYPVTVSALIVGGGGGGGSGYGGAGAYGGGGGGGEVVELTDVVISGPSAVVVGRPGIVNAAFMGRGFEGESGWSSSFNGTTAAGGGGGGGTGYQHPDPVDTTRADGVDGASGGGGGFYNTSEPGGTGTPGGDGAASNGGGMAAQYGGGGGGAGGNASQTNGGIGAASSITGPSRRYGGGGGGGSYSGPGSGGDGGGGGGGMRSVLRAASKGEYASGGGGGGGSHVPGVGGSGVVIIRYTP